MYKILAKTLFIGKKVVFQSSCHSTNEVAADLIRQPTTNEGVIVITNHQTHGKGQRGNAWQSDPGMNLTFSIMLQPHFLKASRQFDLNMAISLGIHDYLQRFDSHFKVKWPNDIYWKDKKIAGILIQNTLRGEVIDGAIIGIGLNINQISFDYPKVISLKAILGKELDLSEVLEELCLCLENRYVQLKKNKPLIQDYIRNLFGYNQLRHFRSSQIFQGRIVDITSLGQLVIQQERGNRVFNFKEVEFL